MSQDNVAHYRARRLILSYFVLLASLFVAMLFDGDGTYTRSLTHQPGILFLYLCSAVVAWILVWRLPYVLRAIFRIPAVEYDGRKLIVRGWNTHLISSEDLPTTLATYDRHEAIILKPPVRGKPIKLDFRLVWEEPATSLIERLTLRPIAPFSDLPDDQSVLTAEQKAAQLRRKALGYFLIGLGLPVAIGFFYPLLPSRHGPLIDLQVLAASEARVFLIGGLVGVAMATAGYLIMIAGGRR